MTLTAIEGRQLAQQAFNGDFSSIARLLTALVDQVTVTTAQLNALVGTVASLVDQVNALSQLPPANPGAVWILAGGVWNDDGVWDDSALWKDAA